MYTVMMIMIGREDCPNKSWAALFFVSESPGLPILQLCNLRLMPALISSPNAPVIEKSILAFGHDDGDEEDDDAGVMAMIAFARTIT